jgi:hypothetical protein
MATFSTNVPQSSQKIAATQAPIQSNFQAVSDLINTNHIGFNDPVNYGKHNYTSLPFQGSDPITVTGEMAVYSKSTPSGPNLGEIFYRYPSNGTIVQLTGGGNGGGAGAASPGYSFMSTTVFMVWGLATGIVSSGFNTITFPTGSGFPIFGTTPYQIYFTANGNYSNQSAAAYISSPTTTNFVLTVPNSGYSTSVYWMAIGSI